MNYLAHLFLAGGNAPLMVGHMLGDFVTPREILTYSPAIQAGIRMHQRVDAFSEEHAVFSMSRRRFQSPYRRYSGILVDLAYDHFLAKHWDEYSPGVNLPEFARCCYTVLHRHRAILPMRLQRILPHMIEDDWLCSYGDLDNVGRALQGISRRFRNENPLAEAIDAVRENYSGLESDFRLFFPELWEFSRHISEQHQVTK